MERKVIPIYLPSKWVIVCTTKIQALATLHTKGHISTAHIDDCYMQGQTYARCVENVIDHVMMFTNLGFVPHPSKSSLLPSQKIITLGFVKFGRNDYKTDFTESN